MSKCQCDFCRQWSLEQRIERAKQWLGDRYLLAKPINRSEKK